MSKTFFENQRIRINRLEFGAKSKREINKGGKALDTKNDIYFCLIILKI